MKGKAYKPKKSIIEAKKLETIESGPTRKPEEFHPEPGMIYEKTQLNNGRFKMAEEETQTETTEAPAAETTEEAAEEAADDVAQESEDKAEEEKSEEETVDEDDSEKTE